MKRLVMIGLLLGCVWKPAHGEHFTMTYKIFGQDAVWVHDTGIPPEYVIDFMYCLGGDVDINWAISGPWGLITFGQLEGVRLSELVEGFKIAVELDQVYWNRRVTIQVEIADGAYDDASVWDYALERSCTLVSDRLRFTTYAQEWTCYATWEHDDAPDDTVFTAEY